LEAAQAHERLGERLGQLVLARSHGALRNHQRRGRAYRAQRLAHHGHSRCASRCASRCVTRLRQPCARCRRVVVFRGELRARHVHRRQRLHAPAVGRGGYMNHEEAHMNHELRPIMKVLSSIPFI
jgi:hypothetical protein